MCGRFTLKTPAEALARAFGGAAADYPPPRCNIAPGMPLAALRSAAAARETVRLRSLLHPYMAEDLEAYPVATSVNDPRRDSPACIERIG